MNSWGLKQGGACPKPLPVDTDRSEVAGCGVAMERELGRCLRCGMIKKADEATDKDAFSACASFNWRDGLVCLKAHYERASPRSLKCERVTLNAFLWAV